MNTVAAISDQSIAEIFPKQSLVRACRTVKCILLYLGMAPSWPICSRNCNPALVLQISLKERAKVERETVNVIANSDK